MRTTLAKTISVENPFRAGLTLSVALATLLSVSVPSYADPFSDGAAVAGVIGLATGAVIGAAAAHPPPPPPQTKYVAVPPFGNNIIHLLHLASAR
jgi:hypothetical protein